MIVLGIFLFAMLVVVHEFGHFIAARRSGVDVEEFGIGFPPKLIGKKMGKHKTLYSLNLIPLGGFVKLKGETDSDKSKGSFGSMRLRTKAKILLAGVGMNVVAVYVIALFLALTGLPKVLPGQFTVAADERAKSSRVLIIQVEKETPAASIGLKTGDQVVSIDGQYVASAQALRDVTATRAKKSVEVVYSQGGTQKVAKVTLQEQEGRGILGIQPFDVASSRYTWSAPIVAAGITLQMLWLTLTGILAVIVGLVTSPFHQGSAGAAASSVTGPVGVFLLLRNIGNFGLNYLLVLIASISASLAVVNALPIPALDGGRLALILFARGVKKRLTPQFENSVHNIGFIVLIGLILIISYLDVRRFF